MIQLLGPIANIATTWLQGKQEKAKAKQQLEVAKVQAQVKRVEQEASWDEKARDASTDRGNNQKSRSKVHRRPSASSNEIIARFLT